MRGIDIRHSIGDPGHKLIFVLQDRCIRPDNPNKIAVLVVFVLHMASVNAVGIYNSAIGIVLEAQHVAAAAGNSADLTIIGSYRVAPVLERIEVTAIVE